MTALVVDSSAVMAIVLREPGWPELVDHLQGVGLRLISAATLVEVGLVLDTKTAGATRAEDVHQQLRLTVVPVDETAGWAALRAFRAYGKGNHRAALNLGDCFTYAAAAVLGLPILCTGNDFAQTDLHVLRPRSASP